MNRIFRDARTLIVPIDDSLIAGPEAGLRDIRRTTEAIVQGGPDAVLGFPGQLERLHDLLVSTETICNLTTSTTLSKHTEKHLAFSTDHALQMDCAAVAVHVNLTSPAEGHQLRNLAQVVERAHPLGLPVLAIMYPRQPDAAGADDNYTNLKAGDPGLYSSLVAHCTRVAADLGASIVKTQYTGSTSSFRPVIEAANGIPVVVAGGPKVAFGTAFKSAEGALEAGASGVSYGRNVFNRSDVVAAVSQLASLVHGDRN